MEPITMAGLMALQAGSGMAEQATSHRGKWLQKSTMNPDQLQKSQWARMMGQQQIQNPYAGFEPVAQKAQSMFQNQTVPGLAERFTSMAGGAMSSPSFGSQLYGSGQDMQESLAALMAQYGLHQQQLGQGLMGMGMGNEFENIYQNPQSTWLSRLFGGIGGGAGSMANAGIQKRFAPQGY